MAEVLDEVTAPTVEDWLNSVNYSVDPNYVPSDFALEFVNFIKLVEGGDPENKTPVVHYQMLDQFVSCNDTDTLNMCHRGIAKSTLKEYLILYLGVFNELPGFGKVPYALYVSDSIDNGIKKMRKSLEFRWDNSKFLKSYIPNIKFTDIRWEFINRAGKSFIVSGYGGKTGVRGTRENGSRPVLALLDDLISDSDARSPTVIADVEDTIYKAIDYALHPTKRKIIWSGTPFNAKDPLYKAVESGAWNVNVYPVCEAFPCKKEDFKGSWEDRFNYDYVRKQYDKAVKMGKVDTFNQELMLRIMSEEDRLIQDSDISWYKRGNVLNNKGMFNFYITTDFATSEKTSADFSVISVWAYNSHGDWFWVDGVCKKQTMDKNVNDLFRLAQMYKPMGAGIEITGQQGGFIPWLQEQMMVRNIYFTLASSNNSNNPGIRPNKNKLERFNVMVPMFKANKIYFPLERKHSSEMVQCMDELSLVTLGGFKSKHDDFCSSGDTLIKEKLPNGSIVERRFDQLKNGSMVMGYDEETKLFDWVMVEGFMQTGTKKTLTITDSFDSSIHLTENHPVMTQRGWVYAGDLTLEDKILCRSKDTDINGLKKKMGIISLQLISLMERGIGYIKKYTSKK